MLPKQPKHGEMEWRYKSCIHNDAGSHCKACKCVMIWIKAIKWCKHLIKKKKKKIEITGLGFCALVFTENVDCQLFLQIKYSNCILSFIFLCVLILLQVAGKLVLLSGLLLLLHLLNFSMCVSVANKLRRPVPTQFLTPFLSWPRQVKSWVINAYL